MESWALRAIESEAMSRAQRELARTPMTFTWMGCTGEQLTWLIVDYRNRTGKNPREINPQAIER